jgi:acyl phosphate:glycerol-3-phosphate acyltransferase
MPNAFIALSALVAAYLIGSIPFAMISSRLFGLADPRSYGSKNPGATNVLRSGNKAAAIVTLLGDMAKGWLVVFLAQKYASEYSLTQFQIGLFALAVFFGHLYPVFLKFKGGKGVATAAGVLLAIDPRLGLATLATWLFVVFALRYSSLAALVAAASAPLYAFFFWGNDVMLATVGIIAMILIGKHWQNLQRLMVGTEPKIGSGSGSTSPRANK